MQIPATSALGLVLAAALPLAASAEERLLDKANARLAEGQKNVKAGAKKLEKDTNQALEKGRKSGKKSAKEGEKNANDAAKALRKKVGTE